MKTLNPNEPTTKPTVFFVYKKSCPSCVPMRELLLAHSSKCPDLEFIEVEASGDNLDFCYRHGVKFTPAVIIATDDYWGPYTDPAVVGAKLERAQEECKREKEKALESS